MKSRGVYETPGGTILLTARRAMESITLDRGEAHLKVGGVEGWGNRACLYVVRGVACMWLGGRSGLCWQPHQGRWHVLRHSMVSCLCQLLSLTRCC
jgi:hypothetical protein